MNVTRAFPPFTQGSINYYWPLSFFHRSLFAHELNENLHELAADTYILAHQYRRTVASRNSRFRMSVDRVSPLAILGKLYGKRDKFRVEIDGKG